MLEFLCRVEVRLLRFDDADAERIEAALRREVGRTREVARVDCERLSASFEGWCEVLWIGVFQDLREKGGDLPTSLRAEFRREYALGRHAGPIADDELERFVAHLAALGGKT